MAQKAALIACLGVLAGGGALAMVMARPDAPPPLGVPIGAPDEDAVAREAASLRGDAVLAPEAAITAAVADERVAVATEDGAPGPVLRIVQREGGAAVPNAEVFTISANGFSTRTRNGLHWSERVMRDGQRWRADAQGRVALPPLDRNGLYVTARTGTLYGARRLRSRDGATPSLTVDTDQTLAVRVRHATGKPAEGVSIALCTGMIKRLDHRISIPTNGEGVATFQHVQVHRVRNRERKKGGPPYADFMAVAAVPQREPVLARVPAAAIPPEPIDLWLSPLGALTVNVRGPDGEPLLTACTVRLTQTRPDPLPQGMTKEMVDRLRSQCRLSGEKELGAATVHFDEVGAGLTFSASVRFADGDWNFGVGNIAGPGSNEERVIELRMPNKFSLLSGRLRLPNGRPAAALKTQMLVNHRAGRLEGEAVTTTADGRFELPLEVGKPLAPYSFEVQAELGGERAGALVALPGLARGKRYDLGELQLGELPVLAHGTIRDDAGMPLGGATIELQSFRGNGWREDSYASTVRTDDSGVYRLFGEPRPLRMRLRARNSGHVTVASPEITPGEQVDLTLERLGGLAAEGVMPKWIPRGALRYRLSANGVKIRDRDLRAKSNGQFRLRLSGLKAGTYDLAFELRGIPRPVLLVTGVRVEPGERVTDPRLQNVDLRNSAFRYVVRVQNADGKRITPGSPLLARLTGMDGQRRDVGFRWKSGRVEFYTTDPTVPVVALSSGYRPLQAQVTSGESLLTLQKIQPVRIRLPGLSQMVGSGTRVRISLVYDGDTGLPMSTFRALDQRNGKTRGYARTSMGKSGGAWLGGNDQATIRLMLDGRYQVVVRLYQNGRPTVSRVLGTVDVTLGGTSAQTASLQPSRAIVSGALAELRALPVRTR